MLNLAAVTRQLNDLPTTMGKHHRETEATTQQALAALRSHAAHPTALTKKLAQAAQTATNSDLRFLCAAPAGERLDNALPLPSGPEQLTVLASDGSQILPDRHGRLLYYVVNTGGIIYRHGSGQTPQTYHPPPVICYHPADVLDSNGDIIAPAEIRLQRDLAELHTLLEPAMACVKNKEPVIALGDGPLRLRLSDLSPSRRDEGQTEYQTMLDTLHNNGILIAGYVDRPRSYYVLSMLHLVALSAVTETALAQSPYRFITDLTLFRLILPPGNRSALFGLAGAETINAPETFFFYLNVGHKENAPVVARVEIPSWLANSPGAVDLLHYAIVRQARITGGYPYVLARAHELAIIGKAERDAVETMLATKLRQIGFRPEVSPKQAQKDLLRG